MPGGDHVLSMGEAPGGVVMLMELCPAGTTCCQWAKEGAKSKQL